MSDTTKWYKSKTVWANAIGLGCLVLEGISGQSIEVVEVTAGILAIVNFALRWKTGSPLEP